MWFSYQGIPYKGNAPSYFNVKDLAWYKHLTKSLPAIQQDTLEFLARKDVKIEDYFYSEIKSDKNGWKVCPFLFWGQQDEVNYAKADKFLSHFKHIPGLTVLSVSILKPHTHITPHYGDTDTVYRVHIPVKIPAGLPHCGLRVGGVDKAWDNIIVFCDAHSHEAWNNTDEERYILIMDVIREEYLSNATSIKLNVISLMDLQKLVQANKWMHSLPGFVLGAIRHFYKFKYYLNKR
jgi:aspartyl/asparaginyl beta-hydroxylase (cupin superfamily)